MEGTVVFHNPIVEMASLAITRPAPSAGSLAGAGAGPAQPSPASPVLHSAPSRTSSAKSSRFEYIRVKDGEGRFLHFLCPECGETREKQSTMHYHMKGHLKGKDFQCKDCGKGFLNKQGLETHITALHAPATSKQGFECPFEDCTTISKTKGNLRTHCMRKHFSEESSAILERDAETGTEICTVCTGRFSSLPAFYYHAIRCIDVSHTDPRAPALDTLL